MPVETRQNGEARINVAEGGKRFRCDFIREGPVYFPDLGKGVEVLRRETIATALNTFLGKPLTIEHVDPRLNVADPKVVAVTVGNVDKVGRDAETGWFFCEGEITSDRGREAALTFNPSCGYRVNDTGPGGRWNNLPYERELTAIEFHHLALSSKRVRYEEADFRLNAVATQPGETPTMFKFLRKLIPAGAPAGTAPTVEEIEIPATTMIKLPSGKEVRLNDVVASQEQADKDAADKVAADEKKKTDDAAAAAAKAGGATPEAGASAAVGTAGIDAATQAAEGRMNSINGETEVKIGGKVVKVSELVSAYETRQNALEKEKIEGRRDFEIINRAATFGRSPIPFEQTAGTLAEGMKRGKY